MKMASRLAGWTCCGVLAAGLGYAVAYAQEGGDQESEPEHDIATVMHEAMLPPEEGAKSLRDRVLSGDATPEEKQQLLNLYISLAENQAPKGDADAWHKKTDAILLGVAKVVVGREGAEEALDKATDCAACHKEHKPPQE